MSESAIDIRDLSLTPGEKAALPSVTLSVGHGETALLYGASGSGKTTLLRAIMGFMDSSAGSITIHGIPMKGHSAWRVRQTLLSYVPQDVDLGPGTVRQCLMRPFAYRANHQLNWDESRATSLMESIMLRPDILDDSARELSGGEKHRVALASAVMLERPVLLLDEITSGLDRKSKLSVLNLIASLKGVTVLAASHDEMFRERAGKVMEVGASS